MRSPFSKLTFEITAFGLILLLTVYLRHLALVRFGFAYTDGDQAIMWSALSNYSSGFFHEPRFYGQAYNTMLEALLAVPLYLCGHAILKLAQSQTSKEGLP